MCRRRLAAVVGEGSVATLDGQEDGWAPKPAASIKTHSEEEGESVQAGCVRPVET